MRITYIKLVGYLGMPTLNPEVFEHTFSGDNVILVLGSNGSGKSRLIHQLTMLPPDKKDFNETGYKEVICEHKGHTYKATADFTGKTPNFGFYKDDGENLNLSGIVSAQRALVKAEFGISPTIHEILSNREKLTNMSIPARKKFVSLTTRVNFDEVMKGYKSLNEKCNLHKLMLKSDMNQYKLEENKLLDPEELIEKKQQLGDVIRSRDKLIETRNGLTRFISIESSGEALEDLKALMVESKHLLRDNVMYLNRYTRDELPARLEEINQKKNEIGLELNTLFMKLTRLDEIHKNIVHASDGYDGDISAYIKKVEKEAQGYLNDVKSFDKHLNIHLLNNQFSTIYHNLFDIVDGMEPNLKEGEEHIFNTKKLNQYQEKIQTLKAEFVNCRSLIISLKSRREHLCSIEDKFECPKCKTSLSLGLIINDDSDLSKNIKVLEDRVVSIEEEVTELTKYTTRCETYFNQYRLAHKLRKSSEECFSAFWESAGVMLIEHPEGIPFLINQVNDEIASLNKYHELQKDLDLAKEKLLLAESVNKYNLADIDKERDEINELVVALYDQDLSYDQDINDIRYAMKIHEKLDAYDKSIEAMKDKVREHNLSRLVSSINNTLDSSIAELRVKEYDLNKAIHDNDMVRSNVDRMLARIEDIKETIHVLELAIEELSPKSGLIAKTISSFLNNVIMGVNATIAKVWSYSMVLKPIDVESEDLNYKFKLEVRGKPNVDDIATASSGMKEIINHSFVLMVYDLLGLDDYPLALDELASAMDVKHTEKMMHMIHALSTDNKFSQIFIANHKENMGFIRDVDIIRVD